MEFLPLDSNFRQQSGYPYKAAKCNGSIPSILLLGTPRKDEQVNMCIHCSSFCYFQGVSFCAIIIKLQSVTGKVLVSDCSSNVTMKQSASGLDGLTWTCWHHLTVECWSVTPGRTWQQREEECFHRYQHSRSPHLYTMEETTLQVHVGEDTVGNGGVWSIYITILY